MSTTRNMNHLRALLNQRFSEGPRNVLSEMRRAHVAPPRTASQAGRPAALLQGLLQRGVQSALRGLMQPEGQTARSQPPQQAATGDMFGLFGGGGLNLDHLIASTLMQGPRTTNVLRTLFNLVPNLIGR